VPKISSDSIADQLKLYSQLMDLHGKDPFKVKSYAGASYRIDKLATDLSELDISALEKVEGVGKSLASKINEINQTGSFKDLQDLHAATPVGVMDMLNIKGIGPKKVRQIWQELGIESVGELLYACNENRLSQHKGFGEKTQQTIIEGINFIASNTGKLHYVTAEQVANEIQALLEQTNAFETITISGQVRRKCDVVELFEWVCIANEEYLSEYLQELPQLEVEDEQDAYIQFNILGSYPAIIYKCADYNYERILFETTATPEHLNKIGYTSLADKEVDETTVYSNLNLPYIIPEMREGELEIELTKKGGKIIELSDLKGILHNHSTYSDGKHSLREMALYCKELGYEYFGICDHSRTAVYAKGLEIERVQQQHIEIDQLNKELAPFKIFKGIESDILGDGSLDYNNDVLATFDFIVASVHQNLKMNEEKANMRLLKAIENPYTNILGHPTGRLLLSRPGYPIDHKLIIDACAANGVAIELNAHPYRLDIDWRWLYYCMEKSVPVSINPDAHKKEGLHDMQYGVNSARKGGLTKDFTLNALGREELEKYFKGKHQI